MPDIFTGYPHTVTEPTYTKHIGKASDRMRVYKNLHINSKITHIIGNIKICYIISDISFYLQQI